MAKLAFKTSAERKLLVGKDVRITSQGDRTYIGRVVRPVGRCLQIEIIQGHDWVYVPDILEVVEVKFPSGEPV